MKQMTFGKRITLGFAATLLVVLALGGFAYVRFLEIQRHFTTSGEMRDLQIARIDRKPGGSIIHHFVTTIG